MTDLRPADQIELRLCRAPGRPLAMELWKCARWRLAASRPARYGTAVLTVATVIAALNQLWIASVNPWILVTAPLNAAHAGNSIISYSWLLDGGLIHKENLSPLLKPLRRRLGSCAHRGRKRFARALE